MSFIRQKEIPPGSGNHYSYLVENRRVGGKVRQFVLQYLGTTGNAGVMGSAMANHAPISSHSLGTTQTVKPSENISPKSPEKPLTAYISSDIVKAGKEEEKTRMENVRDINIARAQFRNTQLPPLTGTEKQIAWAENIRKEQIKSADGILSWDEQKTFDEILKKETSSSYWIEHRTVKEAVSPKPQQFELLYNSAHVQDTDRAQINSEHGFPGAKWNELSQRFELVDTLANLKKLGIKATPLPVRETF